MTVKELKDALNHFDDDVSVLVYNNHLLEKTYDVLGSQHTLHNHIFYNYDNFDNYLQFNENNKSLYCIVF